MKKIGLWQPQQHTIWDGRMTYWLPYTVGCLWSYAWQSQVVQDNYDLMGFFYDRRPIDQVVESIDHIDVAVFSCYIWNFEYNKKMASTIKQRWPNCKILFGGPQITDRPLEKSFFREHPYVDHIVNGEGERVFLEILENIASGKRTNRIVPSTRLHDLDYPSPYASGLFDSLIAQYPEYRWQAVIETNRGCPYACTFCDWGSLTYSKIMKMPEQRVMDDITWCSQHNVVYMWIADANFGIFHERDKKFAQHVNQLQRETGFPQVALAQWAKNGRDKILDVAQIFFNDHNRGFTLSVQSMEDAVLNAIKRKNMETSDMSAMLELCRQKNIPAYTELIVGLPHETAETWRRNHSRLLELGQHHAVDVWWAQLLENSELNSPEQRREHGIKGRRLPNRLPSSVLGDDIVEYEELVIETKYMTLDEMIDCYVYSAIVVVFHYLSGATNILSQFLHRKGARTYHEFYQHLEQAIHKGDHWISDPFFRLKNNLISFYKDDVPPGAEDNRYNSMHNAMWSAAVPLILEPQRMLADLFDIITPEWCQVDQKVYENLKNFAYNHVFDLARQDQYPRIVSSEQDVYRYAIGQSDNYLEPVTLEFSSKHRWEDEKSFLEKAYHTRRAREVVNTQIQVLDLERSKESK